LGDDAIPVRNISSPMVGKYNSGPDHTVPPWGMIQFRFGTYRPPWWESTVQVQIIPSHMVGRYNSGSDHIVPPWGLIFPASESAFPRRWADMIYIPPIFSFSLDKVASILHCAMLRSRRI
jgi:hypothetical protein